jgi:hypothetical protein
MRFWIAVAALLAVLAVAQVTSIRQESQTWDEAVNLAAGYVYLTTGIDRIIIENPILSKALSAVPLLFLNPRVPFDEPSWANHDDIGFAIAFLYHNRVSADRLLFWGRVPSILITLALGLAIALWTRRRYGAAAAVGALMLFVFEPTVIAHGRYAKNDVLATLCIFLAVIAFDAWLRIARFRYLLFTGITLAAAIATKFSSLFLLPVFTFLYSVSVWRRHSCLPRPDSSGRFSWGGKSVEMSLDPAGKVPAPLLPILTVTGATLATLVLIYAPYLPVALPMTPARRAATPDVVMLRDVVTNPAIRFIGNKLGLAWPSHPLYSGLVSLADHNRRGHPAYLLGMHSTHGWWYYFPVAFAVKTPTATLVAIALTLFLIWRRRLDWTLIVPIAIYVPIALSANINIGIRHLLPIYPFLFILVSAILTRNHGKLVLGILAAGLIVESLSVYPNYLAFFNFPFGGPGNGPKYLADSNIDWGQDLIKLRRYMLAHDIPEVCFSYFGATEIEAYGIKILNLPAARKEVNCVAAISVTELEAVYRNPSDFAWLRGLKPVAKIGYSIYIYDLRTTPARTVPTESPAPP